jgi:hypothetical protein
MKKFLPAEQPDCTRRWTRLQFAESREKAHVREAQGRSKGVIWHLGGNDYVNEGKNRDGGEETTDQEAEGR